MGKRMESEQQSVLGGLECLLKLGHSLEPMLPSKSAKRSENINRCIAQAASFIHTAGWYHPATTSLPEVTLLLPHVISCVLNCMFWRSGGLPSSYEN